MTALIIFIGFIALTLAMITFEKLRLAKAEAGNYRLDDKDKVNDALKKYRELIDMESIW